MQQRRRRSRQRGMTLLEIMIVLAIIALVMGLVVGPAIMDHFVTAQENTTEIKVKKYAHEAYPPWAAANGKACPDKLSELDVFMNRADPTDTWGKPLQFSCNKPGVRGFAVWSNGPDGQADTADDITSWR